MCGNSGNVTQNIKLHTFGCFWNVLSAKIFFLLEIFYQQLAHTKRSKLNEQIEIGQR